MKILAVGGGTGGHVMPVVVIAEEIKQRFPDAEFLFVCDRKFLTQAKSLFNNKNVVVKTIAAGKLRRYANLKWHTYLTPYHIWHTHLANIADTFKIGFGFFQSLRLIKRFSPDVVFVKGGYVGLPLGLAAARLHIPIVIRDSDVMPGLTNKILSKYAAYIGTGSPIENYPNYSQDKTKFVGIPVDKSLFLPIANSTKREVLNSFGFTDQHPFLVVTGGGGGSQYLNDLTIEASRALSQNKIQTLLLTGKDHLAPKRYDGNFFRTEEFSSNLVDIFRVANIVVTRAGASSLAELAAAKKAIVLIPHPYLASNHQEKNAEIYQKSGAAIVLKQRELTDDGFIETVSNLAKDIERQKSLGAALGRFAKPDALSDMVDMILTAAGQYARKK